jgi:sigma-B regulation protein RsbU (phosphoserine phosphatase)
VLQRVNRFILHEVEYTTFVTMFLGRLDDNGRTLTYGNAGHNLPIIVREHPKENPVSWLHPTAAAIGLVEQSEISSETIPLAQGDTLLLYTDGIAEAINPKQEEFGAERLAALVGREPRLTARELVEALRRALREFTGGQPLADDATIVVCRITNRFGSS